MERGGHRARCVSRGVGARGEKANSSGERGGQPFSGGAGLGQFQDTWEKELQELLPGSSSCTPDPVVLINKHTLASVPVTFEE